MLDNLKNVFPFRKELVVISRKLFFKKKKTGARLQILILFCKRHPLCSITQQFVVQFVTLSTWIRFVFVPVITFVWPSLRIIFVASVLRVLNIYKRKHAGLPKILLRCL